jgi:DNA-binding NarL/FixJ family response regulator
MPAAAYFTSVRDCQPFMGKPLSPREKQIVRLVCVAKLNKEIAYELCLSEGTVKVYLSVIFKKLRIQNRTQLAMWAIAHEQAGLGSGI